MESAGLEPVTRTFGTTVVKDDALAAYATHHHQLIIDIPESQYLQPYRKETMEYQTKS
jgi:hypothetical protein